MGMVLSVGKHYLSTMTIESRNQKEREVKKNLEGCNGSSLCLYLSGSFSTPYSINISVSELDTKALETGLRNEWVCFYYL